jgi:multiple sugar transport system substrate-binding protein
MIGEHGSRRNVLDGAADWKKNSPRKRISRGVFLKRIGLAVSGSFVLASCGQSNTEASGNLRFMVWGRPDNVAWTSQILKDVDPKTAKRITIHAVVGGEGDSDVAQKFRLMLSAGGSNVPDIIKLNYTQLPEFASSDVLTDLTDKMKPYASDMLDPAKKLAQYDGKFVCVPYELKSKVWFYRRDLFEKAGIDPDKVATMYDFIAAGEKYRKALPHSYIWNIGSQSGDYTLENQLSAFAPIGFFDRSSGHYDLTTNPAFRYVFELLGKMKDAGIVAPVTDFDPRWPGMFKEGVLGSLLINEWMATFLPDYATSQKGLWRAHEWPKTGPSNKGSDAGASILVIPKAAKNPDAAFEVLAKTRLEKEGALRSLQLSGFIPVTQSAIREVPNVSKPKSNPTGLPWAPDYFGKDYFEVVIAATKKLAWMTKSPAEQKARDIVDSWFQRFITGKVSVGDALNGAQSDLQNQIGNPYES